MAYVSSSVYVDIEFEPNNSLDWLSLMVQFA